MLIHAFVLMIGLLVLVQGSAAAQSSSDADTAQTSGSASGEAEVRPWSGWWWPASDGAGPTLYAPKGPLDKYDRYVAAIFGQSPGTRDWEREQVYFPNSAWAGHCNGFAAAALLEPEPTDPISVLDVSFTTADLKGLLVDYHFADAEAWSFGDSEAGLNPADFQRVLLHWLRDTAKGFVLTYDRGNDEVWSYPVYRFESTWRGNDTGWDVSTTVWVADINVPASFVGTRPYPSEAGKTFTYSLTGDPLNPDDGAWTGLSRGGRFAHPGRIWYPDATIRNAERELVSPGLDRQTIANILAGSDGSDVVIPRPRP